MPIYVKYEGNVSDILRVYLPTLHICNVTDVLRLHNL